jgi:photosystem II stability/assembly factor-like uncharacterized protein
MTSQNPSKAILRLLLFTLLTAVLTSCNLPGVTTINSQAAAQITPQPPVLDKNTAAPGATALPSATIAPPPASATPAALPSATAAPGQPVVIEQIHMLNQLEGWGWAMRDGMLTRLLRTADGGRTWREFSPPSSYDYQNSYFLDTQHAWLAFYDPASSTGGILRTTDGGQTWAPLPANDQVQNAWLTFTNPNDGLAEVAGVGAGNVYINYFQTHDGGTSWAPILLVAPSPEPGLPAGTVHLCNICGDSLYYDSQRAIITYGDMAGEPSGVVRLSVTTDLGAHWTDLRLPLPAGKYQGGAVAPLPMTFFDQQGLLPINIIKYNPDGSLGLSALAFYTSPDGGQTWQATTDVMESDRAFSDQVLVVSPDQAYVRCGAYLCSTSDSAQNWNTLTNQLDFDQSSGGPDYVFQYQFSDPANGWALSGQSGATTLWHSSDSGQTWAKLQPLLLP